MLEQGSFSKKKSYTHKGSIHLITGPMFSGKSSELMRRVKRHQLAGENCVIIKHAMNTSLHVREVRSVVTHDGQTMAAMLGSDNLWEGDVTSRLLIESMERADVIGWDEGQFFQQIPELCEHWANKGKIVIVAALDATCERHPFGRVCELYPKCETVTKLSAICSVCKNEAQFTKRKNEGTDMMALGRTGMYEPVCRLCFFL